MADNTIPVYDSKPVTPGDRITTREEAHAAGVAARPGSHREQSTRLNAHGRSKPKKKGASKYTAETRPYPTK